MMTCLIDSVDSELWKNWDCCPVPSCRDGGDEGGCRRISLLILWLPRFVVHFLKTRRSVERGGRPALGATAPTRIVYGNGMKHVYRRHSGMQLRRDLSDLEIF